MVTPLPSLLGQALADAEDAVITVTYTSGYKEFR